MATIKYKDENGWQEIAIGGGGGSITLDSEMSDTSTNAVSNKVIKEYVDSFIPSEFSEEFNDDFTI
jgi:hypothetical protein